MTDTLPRLRAQLKAQDLDGFVVPHGDEFQNEYTSPSAERLAFVTGFTGSAGYAVILAAKAAFFTDARYTQQAEMQVAGDLFERASITGDAPMAWIAANLPAGARLGYDPWLHTPRQVEALENAVTKAGGTLVAAASSPIDAVWGNRPAAPLTQAVLHPENVAGESAASKRARLAHGLRQEGIDAAVLVNPTSIAWLLNIRGGDIPFLPVILSYAILLADGSVDWFVDPAKLNGLTLDGVRTHAFDSFPAALRNFGGKRVQLDGGGGSYPGGVSAMIVDTLRAGGARLEFLPDPCLLPKACKNEIEIAGSREAHRRDGAALSGFLAWFAQAERSTLTELDLVAKLAEWRQKSPLYRGPSFDTISGSGPNGAIMHYHVDQASNRKLDEGSLLVLDSGGQYQDGTTDITRTLALGKPDAIMREMFTLVLKGHIALATARFPKGTAGIHLDALARQFLWARGADFAHGTGHGIGSYLSVHEGPQRISAKADPVALLPGMIVSNEPGYYEPGEYGIRIENLVAVKEGEDGFLEFETLSLAPIDRRIVVADILTRSERTWLNQYHGRVLATLTPLVDEATARWLDKACEPL